MDFGILPMENRESAEDIQNLGKCIHLLSTCWSSCFLFIYTCKNILEPVPLCIAAPFIISNLFGGGHEHFCGGGGGWGVCILVFF